MWDGGQIVSDELIAQIIADVELAAEAVDRVARIAADEPPQSHSHGAE